MRIIKKIRRFLKELLVSKVIRNRFLRNHFLYDLAEKRVLFFREQQDHVIVYWPHDIIGRLLTDEGEYARQPVRDIKTFMFENSPELSDFIIVEFGANIGTHTVYFCKEFPESQIISVEPDPENISILRYNIELNDLGGRVNLIHGAVSKEIGTLHFDVDFYNRGGASATHKLSGASEGKKQMVVECTTADALLRSLEVKLAKIGLVWIDVEGHELEVLEGMTNLIYEFKPPIFLEYTPSCTLRNNQMATILYDNYSSVYLYENRLRAVPKEEFLQLRSTVDVLVADRV